jgi:Ser/Thr protein kinase RdoA (MazF antagonist)
VTERRLLEWAAAVTGGGFETIEPLPGGEATSVFRVSGHGEAAIVKAFTEQWVQDEPWVPEHEATTLRALERAGLPVPKLLAADTAGGRAGVPALLMANLPGRVEIPQSAPDWWLDGLARLAARVHEVNYGAIAPNGAAYQPYNPTLAGVPPAWSAVPAAWEMAGRVLGASPVGADEARGDVPVFLHRDFHPGNVLWSSAVVTGLVDWGAACLGPRGVDVGHCRVNLTQSHGSAAAERFLMAYEAAAGTRVDRIWDLRAAVDILPVESVYAGWLAVGRTDLTLGLVRERLDRFVSDAVVYAGDS